MAREAEAGDYLPQRFARCRKGATAIEYGLIAGLIALAIIASLITIGNTLQDNFYGSIAAAMAAAAGG
ncbi:Flp family type IVb pilin [Stappia sp. F7233]|uniref:Flp family type IVb pilin n=2 Tax=Stappia albiluteola TaxID=2758565 RepID=A0A839AFS6_9HYPH|nr:Flp family type IVb pilin [Stappia albiluteola]